MTDIFYRDKNRGLIGGVCAGIADYFSVNPIWLRLIFVWWALANGAAMITYIILWILLPEKGTVKLPRGRVARHNIREIQSEAQQWGQDIKGIFGRNAAIEAAQSKRVVLFGGLLILVGLVFLADSLHLFGPFRLVHLGPFVLILAGIIALNRALRSS